MSDDIKKDINETVDTVKDEAVKVVEEVKSAFTGEAPNPNVGGGNAGYRAPQNSGSNGKAIASLVLGIIACVVGIWWWYVSLACAIVGIILGAMARKENQSGLATAGFVVSIIGLAITLIMFICLVIIGIGIGLSGY